MNIELKCGNASAVINTVGAEMTGFNLGGQEKIWIGDKKYWGGHSPVLFPAIGLIKDSKVCFDGKPYAVPRHGFVRTLEFSVVEQSENCVRLRLVQNEDTLKIYPFDFQLDVIHTVTADGFSTEFEVTNTGSGDMLYCIGGHPAFYIGNLEDYTIRFNEPETDKFYYPNADCMMDDSLSMSLGLKNGTDWNPTYSEFDKDTFVIKNVKSRGLSLINRVTGGVTEFSFSGFNVLAVWTPPEKQAPFVCIEPWQGMPSVVGESGNFCDKPFAETLKPSACAAYGFNARFIS